MTGSPAATEGRLPEPAAARLRAWERRFADREPAVRAFVPEPGRGARLRAELEALETALLGAAGASRPLAGLWLGVKDIIHAAGLPTRAGSRIPAEDLVLLRDPADDHADDHADDDADAEAVARLRAAGAVVAGKTATTEFAYFAPGPTRNPLALEHTPGGSSSGSAAAVAAGLCDIALGTQTIGSIGRPASFCGVAGWKPSYDRVPRRGVLPLAPSLDHVGLFAATLGVLAPAARVLLGTDRVAAAAAPGRPLRCGVPVGPYLETFSAANAAPGADGPAHFAALRARLAERGFEVVEVPVMEDFAAIVARTRLLVAAEAAAAHRRLFARHAALYAPQTAELIARGQRAAPGEVEAARAGRLVLRRRLTEAMAAHALDCWIAPPALGSAPRGLESTGDPVMNLPWTYAGLPALVVPAGVTERGLPMGLQVIARFGEDEELLAWGEAFEAAAGAGGSGVGSPRPGAAGESADPDAGEERGR